MTERKPTTELDVACPDCYARPQARCHSVTKPGSPSDYHPGRRRAALETECAWLRTELLQAKIQSDADLDALRAELAEARAAHNADDRAYLAMRGEAARLRAYLKKMGRDDLIEEARELPGSNDPAVSAATLPEFGINSPKPTTCPGGDACYIVEYDGSRRPKHCTTCHRDWVKGNHPRGTDCLMEPESLAANQARNDAYARTPEAMAREWLDGHIGGERWSSVALDSLTNLITEAQHDALAWMDDSDKDDEWSEQIKAAFPTRSSSHDQYAQAMKMVGNRHSKIALVALVNWLLRLVTGGVSAGRHEREAEIIKWLRDLKVPKTHVELANLLTQGLPVAQSSPAPCPYCGGKSKYCANCSNQLP